MKVDFYILQHPESLAFEEQVYKLCDKLYHSYRQIFIWCEHAEQCEQLNQALWTLHPTSFIPHEVLQQNTRPTTRAPIVLADFPLFLEDHVLINCTAEFPADVDRYKHIIEVVPADEVKKAKARARYKQYQHPDRKALLACHLL